MTFDEILDKIRYFYDYYLNVDYIPLKKCLRDCINELLKVIGDSFKEFCEIEDL